MVGVEVGARHVGERQRTVVLLVDDEALLGRGVRDMLRAEPDIQFHFCPDPTQAVALAAKLRPGVILQDLGMPAMDGMTLLKRFRADAATRATPVMVLSGREDPIVKAQAFEQGATDYLLKLPDRAELVARIRNHSRNHLAQQQRDEKHRELHDEIRDAAQYMRSLLPPPVKDRHVCIDWRFAPAAQLSGDALGYHWIDERNIAIYLLDVSGHGAGAAMLAVSILNTLLHQTLPKADFRNPSSVMLGLNDVFHMETHGQRFATVWYGVYSVDELTLRYCSAGHPPPFLLSPIRPAVAPVRLLKQCGPPVGVTADAVFSTETVVISDRARLLVYSDGAVDIRQRGGGMADPSDFERFVSEFAGSADLLDRIIERGRHSSQSVCRDDCSLMLVDCIGE